MDASTLPNGEPTTATAAPCDNFTTTTPKKGVCGTVIDNKGESFPATEQGTISTKSDTTAAIVALETNNQSSKSITQQTKKSTKKRKSSVLCEKEEEEPQSKVLRRSIRIRTRQEAAQQEVLREETQNQSVLYIEVSKEKND